MSDNNVEPAKPSLVNRDQPATTSEAEAPPLDPKFGKTMPNPFRGLDLEDTLWTCEQSLAAVQLATRGDQHGCHMSTEEAAGVGAILEGVRRALADEAKKSVKLRATS